MMFIFSFENNFEIKVIIEFRLFHKFDEMHLININPLLIDFENTLEYL